MVERNSAISSRSPIFLCAGGNEATAGHDGLGGGDAPQCTAVLYERVPSSLWYNRENGGGNKCSPKVKIMQIDVLVSVRW